MPTTRTTVSRGGKKRTVVTTTRVQGKQPQVSKKGSGRRRMDNGQADNMVLRNHWNMLSNPCHSTLSESAYRGRAGFVSRFTAVQLITGAATDFGFFFVASPSSGSYSMQPTANSAVVNTPSYSLSLPGQVYLLANADAARCIGFCVDIDYVGTELNRSGMLYSGSVPYTTVPAGGATTVDALKTLVSNETRTPDKQLTAYWFPGVGNEEYSPLGSVSTGFDADNNVLTILGEGLPSTVQIRLRMTIIYEWTPKINTGLMTPLATGGSNPPAAYERLHDAAKSDPRFTQSFMGGVSARANQFAYAAGGAMVNAAFRYGVGAVRRTNPLYITP